MGYKNELLLDPDRVWNLTGQENMQSWINQKQTWHNTLRGKLCVTKDYDHPTGRIQTWFSTSSSINEFGELIPRWESGDIDPTRLRELRNIDFEEDEITKAIEFIQS